MTSLWWDTLPPELRRPRREPLAGDRDVDVCVVGAGYTGLWTALSLLTADPALRVLVVEAEHAGFGASGRNGGWCSALFPRATSSLVRRYGTQAALALRRVMARTVDVVGETAAAEGIECHWAKGGTVVLARTKTQLASARAAVEADQRLGGVDALELLDADQARARVGATGVLGGTATPHCARLHPARLARGLALAVERRGGTVVEGTRALRLVAGPPRPAVVTDHGTVRADVVVRATEAWSATLPGSHRSVIPVYSLMVATEPLPASFWRGAGLARGETFSDGRHLVVYGQRTADDRLAFGGRGAPYHYGSRIDAASDTDDRVHELLRGTLRDLFPALAQHRFTHAWGGPLGVARDWHASVGLDRTTGIAWAGGYVGDGVATANLAGRTIVDLVLGRDTELVHLPWVGHRSPRWEPEPLRWLGVNAGLRLAAATDVEERVLRRPSRTARLLGRLTYDR